MRKCRNWTDSNPSQEKQKENQRAIVSALAFLYIVIRKLVAAQKAHGVEDKTIKLTEAWSDAVHEANEEASDVLDQMHHVAAYEKAIPKQSEWIGSWYLGEGAYGTVRLFRKLDDSGNILNQVVVKDCDYDQDIDSRRNWDELQWMWTTDARDNTVPIEVKTMIDLRGRRGSEYIVKLLNWRIAEGRRLVRLYLEVCDLHVSVSRFGLNAVD